MSYAIGFTNKYYTLWDISDPQPMYNGSNKIGEKVYHLFLQNLSFDLEKAQERFKEITGADEAPEADPNLKGTGRSFWSFDKYDQEEEDHSTFPFGKYVGQKISECEDVSYLEWFYGQTMDHDDHVVNRLKEFDRVVEFNGVWILKKDYCRKSIDYTLENGKRGYHETAGERVELTLMLVNSFSFEGAFGWVWVHQFIDSKNRLFTYMGSGDIFKECYTSPEPFLKSYTVKATINHRTYENRRMMRTEEVTYLKRPSVKVRFEDRYYPIEEYTEEQLKAEGAKPSSEITFHQLWDFS